MQHDSLPQYNWIQAGGRAHACEAWHEEGQGESYLPGPVVARTPPKQAPPL